MMNEIVRADGSSQPAVQVAWIWATVLQIWARSATCQKTITYYI
jgi:hypothetical protein